MSVTSILDYCKSIDEPLLVEYFYFGEKIDDPALFFDLNPGLWERMFPAPQEIKEAIDKYMLYGTTHKLVVSEYGFNLVFR